MQFTSRNQGKTVTALIGSSVNFTWNFSGDVDTVVWGLKHLTLNYIDSKKKTSISGQTWPSVSSSPSCEWKP